MVSKKVFAVMLVCLFNICGIATAADKVTLNDLKVSSKLKKGVPYAVTLPVTVEGKPRIMKACFKWSGEGPYCFSARHVKSKSQLQLMLRTKNPNTYSLEGYVQYSVDGKVYKSNAISKEIHVR